MKCIALYNEDEINIDRPVKSEPRACDVKSKQSKQQPVIAPICINYDHNIVFRNIQDKNLFMDVRVPLKRIWMHIVNKVASIQ